MPSRILPLSEDAISQIHSSKQITSLPGVVLALLENALDADATKVDVSVNFSRGSCVVEDNGCGIPSVEFSEYGGLGKMHHTSKAVAEHSVHGSAGTYLASLAALSLTSITSRHYAEDLSGTVSMHQGRVIARHFPSPPANELSVFGTPGTRIAVHDLFGNMPVRVKQRALLSARGPGTDDRAWLDLKCDVAALLLAWRRPCSVKIRDIESQTRNLILSGTHSTVSSALTERNLNTLHGKTVAYDLRDALPVVFQAGLASFDSRTRWIPVSASTSKVSCRGLICLDPAPTRFCQFFSVGIQPYSSGNGHSAIYEVINKLFSNSSFGTVDDQGSPNYEHAAARLQSTERFTHRQTRTAKSVDRWPMFVLQIQLKDGHWQFPREPENHQLQEIFDVLEVMIEQWLTANHFRQRQFRQRKVGAPASPRVASESPSRTDHGTRGSGYASPHMANPASDIESHGFAKRRRIVTSGGEDGHVNQHGLLQQRAISSVDHLSRIKSGRRGTPCRGESTANAQHPNTVNSSHFALPPLEPGSLSAFRDMTRPDEFLIPDTQTEAFLDVAQIDTAVSTDDYGSMSNTDLLKAAASTGENFQHVARASFGAVDHATNDLDDIVEWRDPVTKEVFKVNSRTGIVLPHEDRRKTRRDMAQEAGGRPPATMTRATTAAGRPLTLNGRAQSASTAASPAVPDFLTNWQNPVFALQSEQSIPVANMFGPAVENAEAQSKCCSHNTVSDYFANPGHATHSKLSKGSLRNAIIINQVDAKYILCSTPAQNTSRTLVLVDQHAASERIILEALLSELCSSIDVTLPTASLRTNTGCSSSVDTTVLEIPLVFEITLEESNLLQKQAPLFAQYGILYDLQTTSQARAHCTLAARTLPPGIAERCKLFPRLLIDLIRSSIWANVESRRTTATADPPPPSRNQEHPWLDRIGSCPKALLEMLNSRACRSAVMFNDVLSLRDCENLMAGLAKCAFPFMCAHGRVSMVPVGSLGTVEEVGSMSRAAGAPLEPVTQETSFVDAYRGWRCNGATAPKNDDARRDS